MLSKCRLTCKKEVTISMGRLTAREQKLLLILGVLLIFSLFFQFFLGKQWPRFVELKQALETKRQNLIDTQNLIQELPLLQERERQAQRQLNLLTARYQGFNTGTVFFEIGKRAQKIELAGVYPGEVKWTEGYMVLPLQIKAKGSYIEVLEFMRQLENLPFLSEITLPSIKALEEEDMVSAQFVLNLYDGGWALEKNLTEHGSLGKFHQIFRYLRQDSLEHEAGGKNEVPKQDSLMTTLEEKNLEETKDSLEVLSSKELIKETARKNFPSETTMDEPNNINPEIRYDFPIR